MAGVNLNIGPADMNSNSWPQSFRLTISTLPEGVSGVMVLLVIEDWGKAYIELRGARGFMGEPKKGHYPLHSSLLGASS